MNRYAFGVGGFSRVVVSAVLLFAATGVLAVDASGNLSADEAKAAARAAPYASAESCALLDDPKKAALMDGLIYFLAKACGRHAEFIGKVRSDDYQWVPPYLEPNTDLNVSNPSGDTGTTRTQSETSIERNPITGTLCSAYNDSYHGVTAGLGFSGYSRSTDGGNTWVDRGALSGDDSGDPSLVWRRVDGKFYYAALRNGGLGLYRSDDDCQTFVFVSQIASGSDDKEIMAIDNDPASPFYGRIYIVWTDFGSGSRIYSIHSSDAGATWSSAFPRATARCSPAARTTPRPTCFSRAARRDSGSAHWTTRGSGTSGSDSTSSATTTTTHRRRRRWRAAASCATWWATAYTATTPGPTRLRA